MDPVPLLDHPAITPVLRDLIMRKLSDKAAVQLGKTCWDGQELVTATRGKALEIHEETVKKYREMVELSPWLRPLSAEQARVLRAELCSKIVSFAKKLCHFGLMLPEERKKMNEVTERNWILIDIIPLLELLEKDNFVQ